MTYEAKTNAEVLRVQSMLCKLGIAWTHTHGEKTIKVGKLDTASEKDCPHCGTEIGRCMNCGYVPQTNGCGCRERVLRSLRCSHPDGGPWCTENDGRCVKDRVAVSPDNPTMNSGADHGNA